MQEVLIIGQGLAGTWLSWWLYQAGTSFKIIDHPDPDSASNRAAGLINPVTGRRMVTTWMIDELMPFASRAYRDMGDFLEESFIDETSVIDFFPSVQMLQAFQKRYEEDGEYLYPGSENNRYTDFFRYDFGWGEIKPCKLINVEKLISCWREFLNMNGLLEKTFFDPADLHDTGEGVEYSDRRYRYIIFCDGRASAENPWFNKLPFALNKGEGLLVEIKGLPENLVFKKGMSLVRYKDDIFWLGSSYEWYFTDEEPTPIFRQQADNWLHNFLKLPYRVLEHFAAVRPATLERRPFVGFHPQNPRIGILNGLGTKGCSLAPYFARQLVEKLGKKGNINPLADISRFDKILVRQ